MTILTNWLAQLITREQKLGLTHFAHGPNGNGAATPGQNKEQHCQLQKVQMYITFFFASTLSEIKIDK